MESSESFIWKKVIDDNREHMVRFSLLLAITHTMKQFYTFNYSNIEEKITLYNDFFYSTIWENKSIDKYSDSVCFYKKIINSSITQKNSEKKEIITDENLSQLFNDLQNNVLLTNDDYSYRLTIEIVIYFTASIVFAIAFGCAQKFPFAILMVSFLIFGIKRISDKIILKKDNPITNFKYKIDMKTVLKKLQEEYEKILVEKKKTKKDEEYMSMSREEKVEIFYKEFKIPRNFLTILQTVPYEGRILLSGNYEIKDQYKTLIMEYLKKHGEKRKNLSIIKALFSNIGENPQGAKTEYRKRLGDFEKYIEENAK